MKKTAKRMLCTALALLLLFAMPLPALAADAESTPEPRTVRVACGINNALYLDDAGKPAGYCAHYLRQIAWLQNWNLEYVEVTWSEGLQYMQEGKLDLMLPVQMSAERTQYLAYSAYSAGFEAIGLYARADTTASFNEYEAMDEKSIGVETGNMCAEDLAVFAAQHGITYTLTTFPTEDALLAALADGQVELVVSSTMNTLPDAKLVALLDYMPFYYCTTKENTELLAELNDGMRTIMIDSPDMAVSVFDATLKGTAEVGYTKEENEIIATTDKIVFAMYDNSLPLSGKDKDGNAVGAYVDMLAKVQEITGITMVPYIVPNDEYIFDYLDDGTVDYVMCSNQLPYTSPNVNGYLGSDPIADYATVAVTRPDYNLDKAQSPVFALTTYRAYLEERIQDAYPGAVVQYYDTVKDCMGAVQKKEADATFTNSWEYNYQSKNVRFQGMMAWENTRISSDIIVVTLAGKNEKWLSIVDKAFHQISTDEMDEIIAANVNMPYSSYDREDRLYSLWENLKVYGTILLAVLAMLFVYLYMRQKSIRTLKEKNRELESASEAKSVFLSRMSHELRTPLNAIAGYAQEQENNCLSENFDAQTELKAATSILRAVRYQQSIIGDLLNMQQIESGKIQLNKEEVDATVFMDAVVEMIRPEAEAKKIDFTYERLTRTNETYVVDPIRLQQVLFNLLHNAIKFTDAGGKVHLTAQATAQQDDTVQLRFVVADTGIGMSREFIETKLFQNFSQEYSGTTSPYEGCGIGLATCKELVNLMGGSITCESTQGKGSTFTVEITAAAVQKKRRTRKPRTPVPQDLLGMRILLCEDNQMNQDIEKSLLQRMGCTVDIAENGEVGCNLFAASTPGSYTMVLMDIRMPVMDGLEAARTMRAMQRPDAATVPILAISANAFEEDKQKSLAAGMNEYLAKPMDARVIHDKIKEYAKL